MIKDPKQIVTPFAFEVSPELLGLPLATPKRRFAALLLDLLIASILTALGAFFLAISASILFFWLAIRNRGSIWWKNLFRYGTALLISIFVFVITLNVTKRNESGSGIVNFNSSDENNVNVTTDQIDWGALATDVANISKNDSLDFGNQLEQIAENIESSLVGSQFEEGVYPSQLFEPIFIQNIRDLEFAISSNDTAAIDTLKELVVPVIAFSELRTKNEHISLLTNRVDKLAEEKDILQDQVENPGFLRTLKGTAEDFGLSVGWIGIYFVLCTALFRGQTIGKRMFNIRVVRLNNKPIGLLYSFERFGGYAAGLATGLLGFAQVYWDANRQGIHDKIAATVVLDTRKKAIKKYDDLRNEILSDENLLD